MDRTDSDALVIFGATGDLCFKKIFPALYNLVRRGHLSIPVIGVARAGWNVEKLADHVRDSVHTAVKKVDESVLSKLTSLLKYVETGHVRVAEKSARGRAAAAQLPGDSAQRVSSSHRLPGEDVAGQRYPDRG